MARFDDGTTTPFPENTIIKGGEFLVFDVDAAPYAFALGKNDEVNLYDKEKALVDSVSYTGHGLDTLGRVPDGQGDLVETKATKGTANVENKEIPETTYIDSTLRINEIETNHDVLADYVEIINIGDQALDISGWYVMDDDPVGHAGDVLPVPQGTKVDPGQVYVFDTNTHFTFGLGKNDTVTLRNAQGDIADEYTWAGGHPAGTWSRVPDGTGDFKDHPNSKGVLNYVTDQAVVINEIESNASDRDWVEIYNNSDTDLDISGWYIRDDSDDHASVKLPAGTTLAAKGYFVFEADLPGDTKHFSFGLGGADKVRLYDAGDTLIDEHAWTAHAAFGLSRIPNGVGGFKDVPLTKGTENQDADTQAGDYIYPERKDWPGPGTMTFIDTTQMFKEDSSGLDYHDGALWLVDNGTATIWKLLLDKKGIPSFAPGFEDGKVVRFQKDAGNPSAPGPDAEGISVDNKGMVYIAAERDNSAKGINHNVILQVDPNISGRDLVALREWNITEDIDHARRERGLDPYQVKSNMGIEAIEWVPNSVLNGKLYDRNTKAAYKARDYISMNDGLFFTGLEDDGFIYVFALGPDGQKTLISEIDTKMGMVMGLNYDVLKDEVWASADNGRMNMLTKIKLAGGKAPEMTYYNPPKDLDPLKNNEGFAIADINVNGQRPVYWVEDGITTNSLKMGFIANHTFPGKKPGPSGGSGSTSSGGSSTSHTPTPSKPEEAQKPVTPTEPQHTPQGTQDQLTVSQVADIFSDIEKDSWFVQEVTAIYNRGLMTGTAEDTFSSDLSTNRAMIVAVLHRLEGSPQPKDAKPFTDVHAGDWYAQSAAWAKEQGLVSGYGNGDFGPQDPITREQMAAMLYNYCLYKGYATSTTKGISSYVDTDMVSPWAQEAMTWAVDTGIIRGTSDTEISPQGLATRAQVAVMLNRFLDLTQA